MLKGTFKNRVSMYLEDFSKEAPDIRDEIVRVISAYNAVLSLKAQSFEELALRFYAQERGEVFDKDNPPVPTCPKCHVHTSVGTKGSDLYRCRKCNISFTANHNSVSSGTKCEPLVWMQVLQSLLNCVTVAKTCEYCKIAPDTYYQIRNRLFHAMETVLDDVKLYGHIKADNTYWRASYKGLKLKESEFDEDSIFYDPIFIPREARDRGSKNSVDEISSNSICIFAAIDDRGHVLTRFVGMGNTNYNSLKHYVPQSNYLFSVPELDPFKELMKPQRSAPSSVPGEQTLLITDKEAAFGKYAKYIGIPIESRVFRKDSVQLKVKENEHDIQKVNALHHRLKVFLRQHNYVSSKYLPGYLTLFEFIENTGASEEAINRIFEVLARPGFDKPASFFKEKYAVPNYLEEWMIGDHPLRKIPFKKLYAFVLYDQLKNKDLYPEHDWTLDKIIEEVNMTGPTIRKNHRDLKEAGYRDAIVKFFKHEYPLKKIPKPEKSIADIAPGTINPIVLAIYDELSAIRELPIEQQPVFEDFLEEKNKHYGTNFKRSNLYAKFRYIEEKGIRPPMKILNKNPRKNPRTRFKPKEVTEAYEALKNSYRARGENVPKKDQLLLIIGERFELSPTTVSSYITKYKKSLKNK